MERVQIGEFEELVLLITAILYGNAYGVNVMDEILEQTGRKINISAVHTALDRLDKKGFLASYSISVISLKNESEISEIEIPITTEIRVMTNDSIKNCLTMPPLSEPITFLMPTSLARSDDLAVDMFT